MASLPIPSHSKGLSIPLKAEDKKNCEIPALLLTLSLSTEPRGVREEGRIDRQLTEGL